VGSVRGPVSANAATTSGGTVRIEVKNVEERI
jgi:hypothetical protein